ncbi:CKLF-like MARVEL transmembrane domain-containing protein 6 isoform X1 [Gadus morhua]|uniref:CKLF-like MARVEL transmembrane domain-containing protein 6 isoform X1 n=1 Tax=Gadus morhua TaxID=8049 RepID=UPI0011B7DDCA|nr:CKLF-like MARVEL transmembrane domain-containing protein 6 isoform X1 [Gadus morhua]
MAGAEVYNSTTVEARAVKTFLVPYNLLSVQRFVVKVAEVLLSFLAFVVEEVVKSCLNCGPLYFFEFISCTAFLFTLLLLILLATKLNGMVGITCWPALDFYYTAAIALLFLLASIVFAADNGGTSLEYASVVRTSSGSEGQPTTRPLGSWPPWPSCWTSSCSGGSLVFPGSPRRLRSPAAPRRQLLRLRPSTLSPTDWPRGAGGEGLYTSYQEMTLYNLPSALSELGQPRLPLVPVPLSSI